MGQRLRRSFGSSRDGRGQRGQYRCHGYRQRDRPEDIPAGQVTTYAGSPGVAGGGCCSFNGRPAGLAIDSSDTLYLADSWGLGFGINWWQAVRTVTPRACPSFSRARSSMTSGRASFSQPALLLTLRAMFIQADGASPGGRGNRSPDASKLGRRPGGWPRWDLYMAADNSVWKLPPGRRQRSFWPVRPARGHRRCGPTGALQVHIEQLPASDGA